MSNEQLIGARFEWSGMAWVVQAVDGDRCIVERHGETMRLHRETVQAMVLAYLAKRPEARARA